MDFPLFPQWGKEWGTVGVPAKERILRKIYYDSDEQSRKALRNVLGSMLICNCTYTSRSVSTDSFFTGLVVLEKIVECGENTVRSFSLRVLCEKRTTRDISRYLFYS